MMRVSIIGLDLAKQILRARILDTSSLSTDLLYYLTDCATQATRMGILNEMARSLGYDQAGCWSKKLAHNHK